MEWNYIQYIPLSLKLVPDLSTLGEYSERGLLNLAWFQALKLVHIIMIYVSTFVNYCWLCYVPWKFHIVGNTKQG